MVTPDLTKKPTESLYLVKLKTKQAQLDVRQASTPQECAAVAIELVKAQGALHPGVSLVVEHNPVFTPAPPAAQIPAA